MSKKTSNVSKFYFLRLGKLNSSIVGYLNLKNSMNTKFRVRDGMVHLNTATNLDFLLALSVLSLTCGESFLPKQPQEKIFEQKQLSPLQQ